MIYRELRSVILDKFLSGIILVYSWQYVLTHLDQQYFTEVRLSLYISLMCVIKEIAGLNRCMYTVYMP